MALQDFVPDKDGDLCALLTHVRLTLPTYFTDLGIGLANPQVAAQSLDALNLDYLCTQQKRLIAAGEASTREKNRARDGDPINPNIPLDLAFPGAPASIPSPVHPGIVTRFRKFVEWLRSLPNYTPTIGEALKIVGPQSTAPDFSLLKPILPLKLAGGCVEIGWGWGGNGQWLEACEIQVDRGNGIWAMLTIDTRPGYIDTEPLPATGTKWKYRAIYRRDDERVGQWSDVAEITVGA